MRKLLTYANAKNYCRQSPHTHRWTPNLTLLGLHLAATPPLALPSNAGVMAMHAHARIHPREGREKRAGRQANAKTSGMPKPGMHACANTVVLSLVVWVCARTRVDAQATSAAVRSATTN